MDLNTSPLFDLQLRFGYEDETEGALIIVSDSVVWMKQ